MRRGRIELPDSTEAFQNASKVPRDFSSSELLRFCWTLVLKKSPPSPWNLWIFAKLPSWKKYEQKLMFVFIYNVNYLNLVEVDVNSLIFKSYSYSYAYTVNYDD